MKNYEVQVHEPIIGEVFEFNKRKYKCVLGDHCELCVFSDPKMARCCCMDADNRHDHQFECRGNFREDREYVYFTEYHAATQVCPFCGHEVKEKITKGRNLL